MSTGGGHSRLSEVDELRRDSPLLRHDVRCKGVELPLDGSRSGVFRPFYAMTPVMGLLRTRQQRLLS